MKRVFLSVIAASFMLCACHQAANKASGTDSTATASSTTAPPPGNITPEAVPPEDAAKAPAMKFEFATHDFGKINQGDSVTYNFKFANVGKSPLIISNAVASCGCTVPEWPKQPIQPEKGGIIKVTFHSAGKMGLQDKMITVTANTIPTQNIVHLVGEVLVKK